MKKYSIIFLSVFLWKCAAPENTVIILGPRTASQKNGVRTGLDVLLEDYTDYLKGKTVGLVTNHTGVSKKGEKNYKLFENNPDITLKRIFAPEHGLYGEASAGVKVEYDAQDDSRPEIVSLYGKTRKPTAEMFKGIDLVIYDIQDVGARFYTYCIS